MTKKAIYRIYLERKFLSGRKLRSILNIRLADYTLIKGSSAYRGIPEKCWVVEYVTEVQEKAVFGGLTTQEHLTNVCKVLRDAFKQNCVLLTVQPIESALI